MNLLVIFKNYYVLYLTHHAVNYFKYTINNLCLLTFIDINVEV